MEQPTSPNANEKIKEDNKSDLSDDQVEPSTSGCLNKEAKIDNLSENPGVRYGHPHCFSTARLLVQLGADINARDDHNLTPLHKAIQFGNLFMIKTLIEMGADVNCRVPGGFTCLMYAIWNGYLCSAFTLLGVDKINLYVSSCQGETALHMAVRKGYDVIIERILSVAASQGTDDAGWSLLHHAASRGCLNMVELLLESGSDHQWKDKNDMTPLQWALRGHHFCVAEFLVEKGADINSKNVHGQTCVHLAARAGYMQILLKTAADIGGKDNFGMTPLHYAAENGHFDAVRLLIERGCDVMSKDNDGRTPLHFPPNSPDDRITELLLEEGADPNCRDTRGATALHYAAEEGHAIALMLLINRGGDVMSKDNDGKTPLHFAANTPRDGVTNARRAGREEMLNLLISKGGDIHSKDSDGKTPLDYDIHPSLIVH